MKIRSIIHGNKSAVYWLATATPLTWRDDIGQWVTASGWPFAPRDRIAVGIDETLAMLREAASIACRRERWTPKLRIEIDDALLKDDRNAEAIRRELGAVRDSRRISFSIETLDPHGRAAEPHTRHAGSAAR